MQVLTPSGYVDVSTLQPGDLVSAFDIDTGAPITNSIENIEFVDLSEWQRWWQPMVDSGELVDYPPFAFYKINGTWVLNSEQSIWRNGTNVCHVRDLIVGDILYDDANNPVPITSIDPIAADGWYRFDVSGDHSYIVDGLTVHNASRFAVNAGAVDWTWDLSTTTHWASSTGGASGVSAPGSADAVTFDGNSGGHVVTPSYGGTGTFQSLTCGAFTGTLAWNTNNESVSLSSTFSYSGSGTRTINMGSGTWTFSAVSTNIITGTTVTNLTLTASSASLVFTAITANARSINVASTTFGSLTISANTGGGSFNINAGGNALTFASLSVVGPNYILFPTGVTMTVTAAMSIGSGGVSTIVGLVSASGSNTATISSANNGSFTNVAFRDLIFTGGGTFTATSSYDYGHNSGIAITAPSAGGPVGQFVSAQRGTPY